MAKNTPISPVHFSPLKGKAKYNVVVPTSDPAKTLKDLGVTIDKRVEVVEIQVLLGTVIYTTDGAAPTIAGAGFRWKVSASEATVILSHDEAKALKVIALSGQNPTLNIAPKLFSIKH